MSPTAIICVLSLYGFLSVLFLSEFIIYAKAPTVLEFVARPFSG